MAERSNQRYRQQTKFRSVLSSVSNLIAKRNCTPTSKNVVCVCCIWSGHIQFEVNIEGWQTKDGANDRRVEPVQK